jgi:hypothetical protein
MKMKKHMMAVLFLLMAGSSERGYGQQGYKKAYALGGLTLISASAKVEKLDPFFGVQYSMLKPHLKITFDMALGKAKEEFGPITIEADDYIYGVTFDYLWGRFPYDQLFGPYAGLGGGYYRESMKLEGKAFGTRYEEDLSASTLAAEAIGGLLFPGGELWATYTIYPNSKNVTAAVKAGVSFFIGGEK